MQPTAVSVTALLTLLSVSGAALAHHPGHAAGSSVSDMMVSSYVTLDQASFDIDGRRGTWSRLSLEAVYAPLSWLSFSVNTPFAWVREEGADDAVGATDMELGAKTRLFRSSDRTFALTLGTNVELPTGSAADGLGGGHYAIIPTWGVVWHPTPQVVLSADVHVATALNAHAHSGRTSHSILAIHSLVEMLTRGRAAYVEERFTVGLGLSSYQGLSDPVAPGPTSARIDGAITLVDGWALTGDFEIPFAGERRTEWRAGLGIQWRLAAPSESDDCGCEDACDCDDGC